MLWDDILKHFTLPPGMNANLVKQWTLTKMATQLQSSKKHLKQTPNFDDCPKLKDHWQSFMHYKNSEEFANKSARAQKSASKKTDYNNRVGRGGYALQHPSGERLNKTSSTKVSYQRSLTRKNDQRIGIMPAVED
jgi:hypothetical protein